MTKPIGPRTALPRKAESLAEALRSDINVILGVRQSRAFAQELASALVGMPFVRVARNGGTEDGAEPWSCTEAEAASLVAELRGRPEDAAELRRELEPALLMRNTGTMAEDHINRLGWRVW
jgi:hypothetical protein